MDTGSLIELALWSFVALLGGYIIYRIRQIGSLKPTVMKVELRDFTPAELASYDGSDASKPILLSVKVRLYAIFHL